MLYLLVLVKIIFNQKTVIKTFLCLLFLATTFSKTFKCPSSNATPKRSRRVLQLSRTQRIGTYKHHQPSHHLTSDFFINCRRRKKSSNTNCDERKRHIQWLFRQFDECWVMIKYMFCLLFFHYAKASNILLTRQARERETKQKRLKIYPLETSLTLTLS